MNILDTYFSIMGGSPPPRPVYSPPPAPAPAPAPVENTASAREKTASQKKRGRTSLITNVGGAPGLGDDESGRKSKLGGY
jgi:hypothetical protein